jgi:hypothetical protein
LYRLIEKKAYRIFETTGSTNSYTNWIHAETYVKMFYENIIPAVETKNREKILRVIKAFQYSKLNRFLIINCFETALGIYFLDPNVIQSLWDASAGKPHPQSTVEVVAEVDSWPQNFALKESCKSRFWVSEDRKRIGFKGVMLSVEKKAILNALKRSVKPINPKSEYIDAIEKLYEQSRLIHKDTTL